MSYDHVVEEAIKSLINDYSINSFIPITESDIHGYLFHLCLNECSKFNLPKNIHINHMHKLLNARKKVDLVINDEIIIEVKFEPDYPGVSKPVVFDTEVRKDIERIQFFKENGVKAIFLFIDEDGHHFSNSVKRYNLEQTKWKIINTERRKHILII